MSPFHSVEPRRVYDFVLEQLREAILLYEYLPGERLPPERELAGIFGSSRATIREAISHLESIDLVERRVGAGGGTFVKSITGRSAIRDPSLMEGAREQLAKTLQFRQWIEPIAAEMACLAGTSLEFEELESLLERSEHPACTHEQFRAIDVRFHLAIASCVRNSYLLASVRTVRVQMNSSLDLIPFSEEVRQASIQQHRRILDALKRRSPAEAKRMMEAHVSHTVSQISKELSGIGRVVTALKGQEGGQ